MTTGKTANKWSWLQVLGAATIGLGWIAAIIFSLLSDEGPGTAAWLILLSGSTSVAASRLQRARPHLSTTLLWAGAVVAIAAVFVSKRP